MFRQFSSYLSALLLALPMCWGCMLQAQPATEAAPSACQSCHSADPSGETHPAREAQDCLCCVAAEQRTVAPDTIAAPHPILTLATLPPWVQAETLSPPPGQALPPQPLRSPDWARACGPPLYHQHCALLI